LKLTVWKEGHDSTQNRYCGAQEAVGRDAAACQGDLEPGSWGCVQSLLMEGGQPFWSSSSVLGKVHRIGKREPLTSWYGRFSSPTWPGREGAVNPFGRSQSIFL